MKGNALASYQGWCPIRLRLLKQSTIDRVTETTDTLFMFLEVGKSKSKEPTRSASDESSLSGL